MELQFNGKVINESGNVSTYLQLHAEVSHKFISTGLWPGDHKSSPFFFICESRRLPYRLGVFIRHCRSVT